MEDQMLDNVPSSLAGSATSASKATAAAAIAPAPFRDDLGGLRAWIGDMLRFLVRQRDIRRAAAEIEAYDDRMLRDIGLHRSEVPRAAWFSRDERALGPRDARWRQVG
jgi:uncharacterized protein YjiS (DUF1127 family)